MNGSIEDSIVDFALFARVAEHGGFSAAARHIRMPQATLSRRVAMLEDRLGVRLFDRTTRRVSLTEAGRRVLDHAAGLVQQAEAAQAAAERVLAKPSGHLRLTAPTLLGQTFVADLIADYMAEYPDVQIEAEFTGRLIDIVQDGFDLALRIGALPDSSLTQYRLGETATRLVASRSYLEDRKAPKLPEELQQHTTLWLGKGQANYQFQLTNGSRTSSVQVKPHLVVNDIQALLTAARSGFGIAAIPQALLAQDLVDILPEWLSLPIDVHVLTPSRKGSLPSVRAFIEFARLKYKQIALNETVGRG